MSAPASILAAEITEIATDAQMRAVGVLTAAPAIGEHTDEVLRSLGYDSGEIEKLRRSKAVA